LRHSASLALFGPSCAHAVEEVDKWVVVFIHLVQLILSWCGYGHDGQHREKNQNGVTAPARKSASKKLQVDRYIADRQPFIDFYFNKKCNLLLSLNV